ncbi:MAG: hypothetical protein AAF939_10155 [Planctomycetota bacterium]
MSVSKYFLCFALIAGFATTTMATEPGKAVAASTAVNVSLDKNGTLTGFAFFNKNDRQNPVPAKVTLASDGETMYTGVAGEDGVFRIDNVKSGTYTMIGAAEGFVGNQEIVVGDVATTGYQQVPLMVEPTSAVTYDQFAGYPADYVGGNFASSSCGCGGGGGIGGVGRGGLRRLLPLAGLVGLVGLSNNDDAASPDE